MNNKPYSSKKWRGTLEELKLGLKISHEPLTHAQQVENANFLAGIEKIVKIKDKADCKK